MHHKDLIIAMTAHGQWSCTTIFIFFFNDITKRSNDDEKCRRFDGGPDWRIVSQAWWDAVDLIQATQAAVGIKKLK